MGNAHDYFFMNKMGLPFTEASYSNHTSMPFRTTLFSEINNKRPLQCVIDYFLSLPQSTDCALHESLATLMKHGSVSTQKKHYDECPLPEKKSRAIGFLASVASRAMQITKIKIVSDEDDNRFLESLPVNGELVSLVARDGALASHQCGPSSTPGPGVMWVEFVVGSHPCSMRFFSGYSGFPLSSKTNISKFQFDPDTVDEESSCGCATANSYLFFIFIFSGLQLNDQ